MESKTSHTMIGILLTHMHKQCESMEWRKHWAGRPAVYGTFTTNHLSYTKTLVPLYIFRAITFFWWCHHFWGKNGLFAPKLKKLLRAVFLEALIVAPPFLDMCLDIYWAWINQKIFWLGHYFRKYSIICKHFFLNTKSWSWIIGWEL